MPENSGFLNTAIKNTNIVFTIVHVLFKTRLYVHCAVFRTQEPGVAWSILDSSRTLSQILTRQYLTTFLPPAAYVPNVVLTRFPCQLNGQGWNKTYSGQMLTNISEPIKCRQIRRFFIYVMSLDCFDWVLHCRTEL
jgi:hypothetical protein